MSSLSMSIYGSQTSKGVGGLLSGLDTDELINQMTAATRNKINREYQSKQKLLYKQEAYREISTKLLTFSNKYFSYSSGSETNILSPKFFESYTFNSSSNYVNVTGDADQISNFKINSITSVATAATYTTLNPASSQNFSSDAILGEMTSPTGESITFDLNGVKKTIDLSKMAENADVAGLKDYLNVELANAYGAGKVTVNINGSALTFSSVNNTDVFGVSNISSDLSILTGIEAGDSNRLNTSKSIGEIYGESIDCSLKINDVPINGINKDMTISEVLKKINTESDVNITYSKTTDKFVITSKETGANAKINISGGLAGAMFGGSISGINGTDTVMNCDINGQANKDIVRSTANFTIDEINIELNEKASGLKETDPPITFDVTNNADEVVERVKQFINDYNEIITLVGTELKEKPRRDYPPLTPEQQDEMEEKEIENWTTEAKKGVLFGDRKISNLFSDLRLSLTGKTDVSDLVLSNMGISSAPMDTSGKLVLDEAKFREKLLENPDKVASLFTGDTSGTDENAKPGLAIQLKDILNKNIGVYGTSGVLIEEAGLDSGRTSDQNYISEKVKKHDEKMAELKEDLEAERKRYWNQFSALEQSLNNLNAQSAWLTDMMGQ